MLLILLLFCKACFHRRVHYGAEMNSVSRGVRCVESDSVGERILPGYPYKVRGCRGSLSVHIVRMSLVSGQVFASLSPHHEHQRKDSVDLVVLVSSLP